MKRLKGGPELKMPELKVPDAVASLYYDLRDRRLLLPIALVVVAMAAVPFLLGSKPEPVPPPPGGGIAAAVESAGGPASSLTVVEARPGLREYRKRLGDRKPTDPFKQRYTGLPASAQVQGAQSGTESSSSGGETLTVTETGTTETTTEPSGGGSEGGGGSPGSGGGSGGSSPPSPDHSGLRLFEFVFDLQISRSEETADGKRKMSEPQVRHRVKTLTQLPGKKTPAATLAGVNLHNGNVMFLVSDEVSKLDGDFQCITRTPEGICELLEIEPGFPLELTYGPNKVLYRIKVTKIDTAWAGKPGDKRSARAKFIGRGAGAIPAHSFSK